MSTPSGSGFTATEAQVHVLQDFTLQSGEIAPELRLSYRTFGQLNGDRSNVILFPTPFGASHHELEWIVGPDGLFDASRYFVVVPDTFGNGYSSSPWDALTSSLQPGPWLAPGMLDNVRAQRAMLRERYGIEQLALAAGWSIGAQQAYLWAAAYPDAVQRLCVICGSARTAAHNYVFLEGIATALRTCLVGSNVLSDELRIRTLRMAGRLYAGWALSQEYYREERWRDLGYTSLEDFLVGYWEQSFLKRHPLNLLAQIHMWQQTDISSTPGCGGTLERALARIEATTLLIPCRQDLYFRVEDNELELPHLRRGKLAVMESAWGHRAGLPVRNPPDQRFLRRHLDDLLAAP